MYQALIRNGKKQSVEVPNPTASPGSLVIKTVYSYISAGTEGSAIEASKPKSLIRPAMNQPRKVKTAWQNLKGKGFIDTFSKISQVKDSEKKKQNFPKPVGYSLSGVAIAVSQGVDILSRGKSCSLRCWYSFICGVCRCFGKSCNKGPDSLMFQPNSA